MFDWVLIDRLPIGSRYNGGQRCGGYLPEQDIVVFFSKQKLTFSSDKNANPTFTTSKLYSISQSQALSLKDKLDER